MTYFRHEIINPKLIRIIDILNNCCYLVIGEKRACLLDTGDGFGDLKAYAKQFTDLEIFVILTHGHIDHGAGAGDFTEVYLHPNDFKLFYQHNSSDFRLARYRKQAKLAEIPIKDFIPIFTGELQPLENEQEFDLGGVTIKMLPVFGHTFGMMVPLIKEMRVAIFGDAAGVGTLLFGKDSPPMAEYKQALLYLKTFEAEYDEIYRNHGTFESPKELLDNVITCVDKVLAGQTDFMEIETLGRRFKVVEPIDEAGNRLDGKQGNLKFLVD